MENRLSKVLAAAGVASRRKCEELIFEGLVTVNGKTVLLAQTMVSLERDEICVRGERLSKEEKKVYFILNKPKGYLCSHKTENNKKLVIEIFEDQPYRLFTVGRLDRDSTGLLLVTNDGQFANKVIHPTSGILKEYLVKTIEEVSETHLENIRAGTRMDGQWIRPHRVVKVRKNTLKVVIGEGKKREVRVLVKRADLSVISLKRIRIGGLTLGTLPEGAYRVMTENDKKAIFGS